MEAVPSLYCPATSSMKLYRGSGLADCFRGKYKLFPYFEALFFHKWLIFYTIRIRLLVLYRVIKVRVCGYCGVLGDTYCPYLLWAGKPHVLCGVCLRVHQTIRDCMVCLVYHQFPLTPHTHTHTHTPLC